MVGLGNSAIKLTAISKETFRITPPPPPPEKTSSGNILIDFLIGIFGAVLSAASGGILAPVLIAVAETTAVTITDYAYTGKVDYFNSISTGLGIFSAANAAVKGVKLAEQTSSIVGRVDAALVEGGASSLERDVFKTSIEGVVTKQIGAADLTKNLVKAGMTDEKALQELKNLSNILKEEGVNASRFQNEVDYALQETNIFDKVVQPLKELGLNPDNLFVALRNGGIDVVKVREVDDLVKAFRSSDVAYSNLQKLGLNEELEKLLERDIEPTVFTRILNAQKLERGVVKTNKLVSMINPNTLIGEVANKIFDPIKGYVDKKITDPLKKKALQKVKKLVARDLKREKNKNGVYPCFTSGAINYLRAVPLGAGKFKCFVVWRKWGYQPVLITPLLELNFIQEWAAEPSPGHIYHEFRRKYGKKKGEKDSGINSKNEAYQIFNLLGFIPDKYISLGVSLIGNITTATSVISQDLWGDFARNEAKYLEAPIRDKILEIGGGEFAKAVAAQAQGSKGSVSAYFEGKLKETAEAKEGAFRSSGREGKGKVDAIRGMSSVIK